MTDPIPPTGGPGPEGAEPAPGFMDMSGFAPPASAPEETPPEPQPTALRNDATGRILLEPGPLGKGDGIYPISEAAFVPISPSTIKLSRKIREELTDYRHQAADQLFNETNRPVDNVRAVFGGVRKAILTRRLRLAERRAASAEDLAGSSEYIGHAVIHREPYRRIFRSEEEFAGTARQSTNPYSHELLDGNPATMKRVRPHTRRQILLAERLQKINKERAHAITIPNFMHGLEDLKGNTVSKGIARQVSQSRVPSETESLSRRERRDLRQERELLHHAEHHLHDADGKFVRAVVRPHRQATARRIEAIQLRRRIASIDAAQDARRERREERRRQREEARARRRGSDEDETLTP